MIRYFSNVKYKIKPVSREEANWISVTPPFESDELEIISREFELDIDLLKDAIDIDERSRYEREDDQKFLLINTPIDNPDTSESAPIYITAPIGIFLGSGKILTISGFDNPVINRFEQGYFRISTQLNHVSFTLLIIEQSVFEFLKCLKKLNVRRGMIENELYHSSRNRELQQLLRIEKSLVYFVNSLSDNDLLNQKIKRIDFLEIRNDENLFDLFEDIIIDNGQALEMANVHTNILSSTMEAYASIISNNMNVFIQRLTMVTIILMFPTLIASFYGMNLEYLPFQSNKNAFFLIILISFAFGIGLIWLFTRRGKK